MCRDWNTLYFTESVFARRGTLIIQRNVWDQHQSCNWSSGELRTTLLEYSYLRLGFLICSTSSGNLRRGLPLWCQTLSQPWFSPPCFCCSFWWVNWATEEENSFLSSPKSLRDLLKPLVCYDQHSITGVVASKCQHRVLLWYWLFPKLFFSWVYSQNRKTLLPSRSR